MILCAMLAACSKWLGAKNKENRKTLIAEVVAAMVAAIIVFFSYMGLKYNVYMAYSFATGFGYLGVEGAAFLAKHSVQQAAKKAGIPMDDTDKNDKTKNERKK